RATGRSGRRSRGRWGVLEARDRAVELLHDLVAVADVVLGLGLVARIPVLVEELGEEVLGLAIHLLRLPQRLDRVRVGRLGRPEVLIEDAEVVVGVALLGVDALRLLVLRLGAIEIVEATKRDAESDDRVVVLRRELDGLAEELLRGVVLAEAEVQKARVEQRL